MCPEEERGVPEYSLDDLLRGRGSIFRWEDLQLQGTPLQLRVWQELFNLLPDELITYSELASRCGYPRAVRAVATAVGKNPVSLIIPCHRVVRKSGNQAGGHKPGNQAEKRKSCSRRSAISAEAWELGNYRWGSELKKRILEWEGII
ncbi:MAG: methylated-DNA--[Bacteroidales bacterium]|nr:methylated-DNA--[protein]-cysteine S-methyltransferase [Bacteroidales bacterium]